MNDLDKSILKILFTNKKYAIEFAAESNEKLFDPSLWRFAKTIIDYVKVYKVPPTKRVILEKIKALKNDVFLNNAESIITELETHNYDEKEYKHDLEKIKKRFAEKVISDIKAGLNNSQSFDVNKSLQEFQNAITTIKSLNEVKAYTQKDLKEALPEFKERYVLKKKNPEMVNGIMTGYTFLDYVVGGISTGTLSLICGFSGGGKSMMLSNLAINMWLNGNSIYSRADFKEGHDVLYFSLEMPFNLCQERTLSRLAMVPQRGIKNATLNDDELKSLSTAMSFIEAYPYNFEIVDLPRNSTMNSMEMIYNDLAARKRPPKVVIVDYLSLMSTDDSAEDGDWLQLGKSAEKLHEFSRVYDIAVLSAVQLNEPKPGAKHSDENFGLGAVSRSRMINHNADLILSIEKREKENERPDLPVHIIKSRNTEHGKGTLYKNFGCCAILNNPETANAAASDLTDISDRIAQFGSN